MFSKVIKAEIYNYSLISNHFDVGNFLPVDISFMQRWMRKKGVFL